MLHRWTSSTLNHLWVDIQRSCHLKILSFYVKKKKENNSIADQPVFSAYSSGPINGYIEMNGVIL